MQTNHISAQGAENDLPLDLGGAIIQKADELKLGEPCNLFKRFHIKEGIAEFKSQHLGLDQMLVIGSVLDAEDLDNELRIDSLGDNDL